MSRELNQYILKEYTRLHSVMEQREFMEKVRFLMMAGEKEFSCYYSDASLPVREFYSVADTLYGLNNLWMLSGFLHKNRHILFEEIREREGIKQDYDFMEPCNYGKDVILSRMFQVMEGVRTDGIIVDEVLDGGRNIHRMKAYSASVNSGKNVPQLIIQGNWVEQCGFEIGCSVRVECFPNKLVVLKE